MNVTAKTGEAVDMTIGSAVSVELSSLRTTPEDIRAPLRKT